METYFLQTRILSDWTDLGLMTFHFHSITLRASGTFQYIADRVCYLFNLLQFAQHRAAFDRKLHEGIQAKKMTSQISKIAFCLPK